VDNSLFQLAWTLNYLKWGFFAITLRELIREHHIVCLLSACVCFNFQVLWCTYFEFKGMDLFLARWWLAQTIDHIQCTTILCFRSDYIWEKIRKSREKKQNKPFFWVSFESIWFDEMDIIKARSFILLFFTILHVLFKIYISSHIKNWILRLNNIWSIE